MTYDTYHISVNPSNRFILLFTYITDTTQKVFAFLKIPSFRTGIITYFTKRILRNLIRTNIVSLGLVSKVEELTAKVDNLEDAKYLLDKTSDILKDYREIFATIEHSSIYQIPEIRSIADDTLDNFYSAERDSKKIYYNFHIVDNKINDEPLINYATSFSLNSL